MMGVGRKKESPARTIRRAHAIVGGTGNPVDARIDGPDSRPVTIDSHVLPDFL